MTWVYTGKQVVYHARQQISDDTSPKGLAAMNREIDTLQDELSTIKTDEKKARAALLALEAKPRLSELQRDIQRLKSEQDDIQARLARIQKTEAIQVSSEERSKLEHEWKTWQRQAVIRRRICRDLWGRCTEVLPENTTAAELWVNTSFFLTTRASSWVVPVLTWLTGVLGA
ncbi:hypothetical protein N7532_001294 [Penicillium argentinense]|uniref:Uncharacterized protein n=1 Tax=Penicillium argentinense TaxID=1131581 RepID=A0A9W9KL40_9EURO|nr:uncharacterized protein N7532_001294 [Penicillium argentinense]KAJ5110759.1 hypothetical protein N7532_001294 [Penicillium argentinense]